MGILQRLRLLRKMEKHTEKIPKPEEKKSFFLYIVRIPQILTYYRRSKGIPLKKLELTLVDNEDQPAYQIIQIAELLMKNLNLLYIVTGRREEFEELVLEALEERGLLIVLLEPVFEEKMPGNLVLDLRDWEKHLDIISALSYNTVHYEDTRPFGGC